MVEDELVKMSPKGQLVVPKEIREKECFRAGDRFIPFQIKEGVLFKRVRIPDVKIEFKRLSQEIQKQLQAKNIKEDEVKEAIKWARKR